jgi:hypothetical protein
MAIKKHTIFDIDNCLANDEWRIPLINWAADNPDDRYAKYHAAAYGDAAHNADKLAAAMIEGHGIIFLTARPTRYAKATEAWLDDVLFPAALSHVSAINSSARSQGWTLIMRNNGDHRHSHALKESQLNQLVSHYEVSLRDVAVAYDDRQEVIDMYQARGIPATRLWIHDTCAYTDPSRLPRARAPDLLEAALATFRERNAVYGDNYRLFSDAFLALFPDRALPPIRTTADMDRLQVLIQMFTKMSRYAQALGRGGHRDSAHDMIVYAAMLEEFTQ